MSMNSPEFINVESVRLPFNLNIELMHGPVFICVKVEIMQEAA